MGEFKRIPGFPGYVINENGDIYNRRTHHKISASKIKTGYYRVVLYDVDGNYRVRTVAGLVYKTFKHDYDTQYVVRHIDRNKENNHVSNLHLVMRGNPNWMKNGVSS